MKQRIISTITRKRLRLFVTLTAFVFILGPTVGAHASSTIIDDINLSIQSLCSFVAGNSTDTGREFTGTGINGYEVTDFPDNGVHTFNVACNHISGYTVTAYATDLKYDAWSIDFVEPSAYHTGGNSGLWTAIVSGGDDGAVLGIGENNAKVIKHNDGVSAMEGDIFSVQYKAYIGKATSQGTYTGNAYYTLIMNPINPENYDYSVIYHSNGIAGTPASVFGQTALGQNTVVTLSDSVPTLEGRTFRGWDTSPTASTVVYRPGQEVTIPEISPYLNLYAVWDGVVAPAMQDFTLADADALNEHQIITLRDSRDGKEYLVSKMKDGKVWMVQNLAIEPGTRIYNDKSNITAAYYDIPNTTSLSGAFSDNDTAYAYKRTEHVNASPNLKASNTGVYYSWQAATAGTGSSVSQGSNASVDICPKGWRLPTGTSSGEFATLYNAYGSHANFKDSPWGSGTADTLWGDYDNGSLLSEGSSSIWWSSTRYSDALNAYSLYMNTSGVYPSNDYRRRIGFSVRCVYDDRTMQNFNATTMNIGDEKILTDARDGKQYVVRKYEDGAVWMAQDLDMDIYISDCTGSHSSGATSGAVGTCKNGTFVPFTSSNTNITEDWTIASGSKGYDVQRTTGTAWDQYGRNSGTTNTYEVRSYDGNNNKCMKSYSSKSSDNTGDGETSSSSVVDCGSGGTTSNAIGEANTQRIGNYYNWTTATAGTVIEGNGTATKSICPKGWQLPAGGTTEALNGVKGSFGYLFKQEGVVSTVTTSTSMSDDIMKKTTGNTNTTKGHQLTFLRSGYYNYSSAVVKYRGTNGNYWSSESYLSGSNYNGRALNFSANYLSPGTGISNKGYGYAVRCVAL